MDVPGNSAVDLIIAALESGEMTRPEAAARIREAADSIKVGGVCLAQVRPAHRKLIHQEDAKWADTQRELRMMADDLETEP
jgi:acetyl/propionyl-CoA carboxylase alpha subunit